MVISEFDLKEKFEEVKGSRKTKRQKLINDISVLFISFCKQNKTLSFPRSTLNFLVEDLKLNESKKRKIIQEVLNLMKEKGLISESVKYTPIYTYRNKPLFSFYYGSFKIMMRKNGYKKYLYKEGFNPAEKRFYKNLIKKVDLDENLNNCDLDFNRIETKSFKNPIKQGVKTNGNLSVVRDFCFYSEKRTYTIL